MREQKEGDQGGSGGEAGRKKKRERKKLEDIICTQGSAGSFINNKM